MDKKRLLGASSLVAALVLAVSACSGGNSATNGGAAPSTPVATVQSPEAEPGSHVTATLTDFKVALSKTTVSAGPVTFDITNAGPSIHELVVLKTKIPAGKLPPNAEEAGKVQEESGSIGHIGEQGDMVAGATATLTLDLKPGKYQIVCNLAGHYAAGMYAECTVT